MRLFLPLILVLSALDALACSCSPQIGIDELFESAAHVAVVEVHSAQLKDDGDVLYITRRVDSLKGSPASKIKVWGVTRSHGCYERGLEMGSRYVLFLGDPKTGSHNACSPARPADTWEMESLIHNWKVRRASNQPLHPTTQAAEPPSSPGERRR